MNTAELGAYIREPNKLGKEHIEDLKNLCETHSYSGLLHVLYLKALGNAKSVDFEDNLKAFAIKIPNRDLLYQLINDEDVVNEVEAIQTAEFNPVTTQIQEESIEKQESDQVSIPRESETKPVDSVSDFSALKIETVESENLEVIEDAQMPEFDISEPQFESQIFENQEGIVDHLEEIVEDLAEISLENQLPLEAQEDIHETKIATQILVDQNTISEGIVEENEFEIEDQEVNQKQEVQFEIIGENQADLTKEIERIYSLEDVSWIDNNITFEGFSADSKTEDDNTKTNISVELEKKTTVEVDSVEKTEFDKHDSRKSFYDWLTVRASEVSEIQIIETVEFINPQEEIITQTIDNQKEKVQALVDRFIEAEPKISRPKAEFFSPVKSAKESVNEEGIPVSETLAKIYELQGNFPKAIAVFEKLKELRPQKAAEFEQKIQEISAKISS